MWNRRLGIAAVAAVLAVGIVPLEAQQRGPGGGRGPDIDEQMAQLTEQLELTEEQATSVRAILEVQGEKRQELFQSSGGDREAMRAAMMEMMEEVNVQLAEILTEDQMTKYTQILEERRQRRRPPF